MSDEIIVYLELNSGVWKRLENKIKYIEEHRKANENCSKNSWCSLPVVIFINIKTNVCVPLPPFKNRTTFSRNIRQLSIQLWIKIPADEDDHKLIKWSSFLASFYAYDQHLKKPWLWLRKRNSHKIKQWLFSIFESFVIQYSSKITCHLTVFGLIGPIDRLH